LAGTFIQSGLQWINTPETLTFRCGRHAVPFAISQFVYFISISGIWLYEVYFWEQRQ